MLKQEPVFPTVTDQQGKARRKSATRTLTDNSNPAQVQVTVRRIFVEPLQNGIAVFHGAGERSLWRQPIVHRDR